MFCRLVILSGLTSARKSKDLGNLLFSSKKMLRLRCVSLSIIKWCDFCLINRYKGVRIDFSALLIKRRHVGRLFICFAVS